MDILIAYLWTLLLHTGLDRGKNQGINKDRTAERENVFQHYLISEIMLNKYFDLQHDANKQNYNT